MSHRLAGKVAAITGASQGIGLGIAQKFAAEGADIAFCYRSNKAGADEAAAPSESSAVKPPVIATTSAKSRTASSSSPTRSHNSDESTSWSITPA